MNTAKNKSQYMNSAIKYSHFCSWQVNYLKKINGNVVKANL